MRIAVVVVRLGSCSLQLSGRPRAAARKRQVPPRAKAAKSQVFQEWEGDGPGGGLRGQAQRASRPSLPGCPRNAVACQSSDACRKSSIKRAAATSLSESLARAELFPVDCLQSLYKVTLWRSLSAWKYLITRLLGVDGDRTVPLRSSRAPHYAYIHTQTHAA